MTDLPIKEMDPEVVELCEAMNRVPGIRTIESCCGHGERPFIIFFRADDVESLPTLLFCFDGCHCGHYGWEVLVSTDCAMSPAVFRVEGPAGDKGYEQAKDIAGVIDAVLEEIAERDEAEV